MDASVDSHVDCSGWEVGGGKEKMSNEWYSCVTKWRRVRWCRDEEASLSMGATSIQKLDATSEGPSECTARECAMTSDVPLLFTVMCSKGGDKREDGWVCRQKNPANFAAAKQAALETLKPTRC